jgi:hypothetical protein
MDHQYLWVMEHGPPKYVAHSEWMILTQSRLDVVWVMEYGSPIYLGGGAWTTNTYELSVKTGHCRRCVFDCLLDMQFELNMIGIGIKICM